MRREGVSPWGRMGKGRCVPMGEDGEGKVCPHGGEWGKEGVSPWGKEGVSPWGRMGKGRCVPMGKGRRVPMGENAERICVPMGMSPWGEDKEGTTYLHFEG